MFQDHEGFRITVLRPGTAKGYRRQKMRRARRRTVSVKLDTVHNTEAIIWLQGRG